jgi:hypothetical protein
VLYRKRAPSKEWRGQRESGALSIQRLEGSRPGCGGRGPLWELNGGKGRCRGAPTLYGEVQKTIAHGLGLVEAQNAGHPRGFRGGKKRCIRRQGAERRIAPKHAELSGSGEFFHAAAVSMGGERSRISAAVSRSMTTIGAPHLGHGQRWSEFWMLEVSWSVCGAESSS